ncbi:hypothetical protein D3C80_976850 [compost metagenome]
MAVADLVGGADGGRARGGGFQQQVVADGFQTRLVEEGRQLQLTHHLGRGLALGRDLDLARLGDGDVDGVLGDGDGRLDRIAVFGDQLALAVDGEVAGAGVGDLARRHGDLEVALAVDGDVVGVAGAGRAALFGDAVDAAGLDAGADLDAGRDDGALGRGLRAHAFDVLVQQVLELGPLTLEADRVHVGDVVGDDLDVQLLSQHAGGGGSESAHRSGLPY